MNAKKKQRSWFVEFVRVHWRLQLRVKEKESGEIVGSGVSIPHQDFMSFLFFIFHLRRGIFSCLFV